MKVGMVCPYDWSFPGGVRTHIKGLTAALQRRGIEVEVIAPSSAPEPDVYRAGGALGVPVNGSVARLCFTPSARRRIVERLREGDIDVLHLHEPAVPSVSLLALAAGVRPAVATFHAGRNGSLGYRLASPGLRRILNRLSDRIAVSEAAKALIARYFPGDYRIIPNGIDAAMFAGASPDPSLSSLRPFVLFLGRPEPRKGLGVAIKAVEALRRGNQVNLVVAGPSARDVPPWVHALGPIGYERLPSVYKSADVFCAPSLGRESFGIVLIESMASGTPVVCSSLEGYMEATGGAALAVPPGDVAALTAGLRKVLEEPEVAGGLVARGRARAAWLDWDRVSQDVIDSYERAL